MTQAQQSENQDVARRPLVHLRPWSVEPFWRDDLGIQCWSWARRSGKSFTMASKSLRSNMEHRGNLNLFVSASIKIGGEFLLKEAQVWQMVIQKWKAACTQAGLNLTSTIDGLEIDDVADMFEHQKLETKVWHSQTVYSRSIVIAPNPDTAVGWGGNLFIDEFGRIDNFKDVLEAVLPFIDENPQLFCVLASTPPPDDAHYSYELTCPPHDDFPVNPAGNWYVSKAGFHCHRVDVYDRAAAGFPMYDTHNRHVITPEEHRARAFDKTAWDRNYGVKYIRGGSSALSMLAIHAAMEAGAHLCAANSVTEDITL